MPYGDDPSNSEEDQVRFLVGDTDNTDLMLSDNEVAYLLAEFSTPVLAASEGALRLAAKFARQVNTTVGRVSEQCAQRAQQFRELADKLKAKADAEIPVIPYAGGISKTDKRKYQDDEDLVGPYFTIDRHDDLTENTEDKEWRK